MAMNWDMIGHEWAVDALRAHLRPDAMRHAFLFCGPQGVGRRTLALRFAMALSCERFDPMQRPCGSCRACRQINGMAHPDLSVVQAEETGMLVKIEQVLDLQHTLSLSPYTARYRVALLLNFDQASIGAMNAMLKTLEEPGPQVVILLTAENPEMLLPTIVSRCEVLQLRAVPVEQTSLGLQKLYGIPADQASLLAHVSGGRPGYASRLFHDPEAFKRRQAALDELSSILAGNRLDRFSYVDSPYRDPSWREKLQIWLSFWRDVLVAASGAKVEIFNLDREQEIRNLASQLGQEHAYKILAVHDRSIHLLEQNCNPRLVLEVLMLDLPYTIS